MVNDLPFRTDNLAIVCRPVLVRMGYDSSAYEVHGLAIAIPVDVDAFQTIVQVPPYIR